MAPNPQDQSYPPLELRFRATNDWLVARGFKAGFPNCHEANYNDGRGIVWGTHLMGANVADWGDVRKADLQNVAFDDYRMRFATANSYAVSQGYDHGFPNFHQANYGQGTVYGTFFIKKGFTHWLDVNVTNLGMSGNPTNYSMKEWFRRTHDFAVKSGYPAGMPTGHYANYGTWVIGVIIFHWYSIEWRDVPGSELGYSAPAPAPEPAKSGVELIAPIQDTSDPFLFRVNHLNPAVKDARITNVKNTSRTKTTMTMSGLKDNPLGLEGVRHTDMEGKTIGPMSLAGDAGTAAFNDLLVQGDWVRRATGSTTLIDSRKIFLQASWKRP